MYIPSAEHLAEIMTELYEDPFKLKAVGEACYKRATDPKYQWDTIAAQFKEEFQEVLKPAIEKERPVIKKPKKRKKTAVGMA
jgi:glycosyltransferase involved in cell wall biosynthesis